MHKSVLLEESIENLNIKNGGVYVDATLGFGGHSSEILKRNEKGKLFCFDQDDMAINYSNERLSKIGNNFSVDISCSLIFKPIFAPSNPIGLVLLYILEK